MTAYSVPAAYLVHRPPARTPEVRTLLALAPRSAAQRWSGRELHQWVGMVEQVSEEEVERALVLAAAWGAGESQQAAAAAHIVLVRNAPRGSDEDAALLRRDVADVCAHLRSRMSGALSNRLPRVENARQDLPSAIVWAYFFACIATLLFAIVITR
jgi:hypothetical protein